MAHTDLKFYEHDLHWYLSKICDNQPYSLSRWGDGELFSACGYLNKKPSWKRTANCDGHGFHYDTLGRELAGILKSKPPYEMATAAGWFKNKDTSTQCNFVFERCKLFERTWHQLNLFHYASIKGFMPEMISAFRTRPIVLVGPQFLKKIFPQLAPAKFVPVGKDCWKQIKTIEEQTRKALDAAGKGSLLLLCAGMSANVLVHRLYSDYGSHSFLIDWGSVFDPYCGVISRSYMRNQKWRL